MKKIDGIVFGFGTLIATALALNAYYANSHPQAARVNDIAYFVLFPPSVGFMAMENASQFVQIIGTIFLVIGNGFLYWSAFVLLRTLGSPKGRM